MLELAARFSETLYRGPLAHEKNAGCNMAVCPLHPAPYEEKRWMHRHYWKSSSKAYILERFSENLS